MARPSCLTCHADVEALNITGQRRVSNDRNSVALGVSQSVFIAWTQACRHWGAARVAVLSFDGSEIKGLSQHSYWIWQSINPATAYKVARLKLEIASSPRELKVPQELAYCSVLAQVESCSRDIGGVFCSTCICCSCPPRSVLCSVGFCLRLEQGVGPANGTSQVVCLCESLSSSMLSASFPAVLARVLQIVKITAMV